ncbi:hypothetical protein [Streptococcus koreensis]|uniref:Uncharacterized protein n=1 Tax=Streptococcus koreensis TaxID=2382163 RepID=A0ABN5PVV5_9STRE|nr:hypothetical protein [Streptococcus koreensis]AYF94355.1 hypothetical protein D7D50_07010 [Streptococcus koreensis]
MTDQQNSESNQEHQSVPEGTVQPSMAGEEQNPPKNKDKEAYVLGDSLLSNNEMKPEKRVGSTLVLSIALVLATIYLGWSLLAVIVLIEWTIMQQLHFLCIIIATLLLWNGKTMGNRTTLYTSAVLYFVSMILAYDPAGGILLFMPLVIAIVVFFGTVMFDNGE